MKKGNGILGSAVAAVLFVLPGVSTARADSVASKNKDGNRLFSQEKYQEAEKAYLDAEVQSPDRPELLYNLGNTLIKQKKYEQALQSLRQAVSKGDEGLQESSWFNAGNALFEMGNFRDSAQAYIQALRINPADRDAKYNLEMAPA
jgi:Ca-activated chloride channel homolog